MIDNLLLNYFAFVLSYHIPALLLFVCDYFQIFNNHKIQKNKTDIISIYRYCFPRVFINTLLLPIPAVLIFNEVITYNEGPVYFSTFVWHCLSCYVMTDIFFYSLHRLFHTPFLYKFHKVHHRIVAPVGFSTLYAHWLDVYFSNILPIYLPLIIIQPYWWFALFWIILTTVDTVVVGHSGYDIDKFHNNHHRFFNVNYGTNLFMDSLLGTKYCNK